MNVLRCTARDRRGSTAILHGPTTAGCGTPSAQKRDYPAHPDGRRLLPRPPRRPGGSAAVEAARMVRIIVAVALLSIGSSLIGCSGGTSGPCVHVYRDALVHVGAVVDSATGS